MNVSLIGISALFYLALVSAFYVIAFAFASLYRRLAARSPQSGRKRMILIALSLPPIAALLPTGAGVVLRHLHGAGMRAMGDAIMPADAPTALAHHTMACARLFERLGTIVGFGVNSTAVSQVLGVGTWLLFAVGIGYAARLTSATYRLETGIAPLLSAPSPRLVESLGRVARRLGLSANLRGRFFECALPPDRSSVIGLTRAKCALSRAFIEAAPPEEIDALVAHEAAHLRSGDVYAAFAVGVLNCVFFFLRPVRLLSRWWRESAELCADDVAVRGTGDDPLAVASAILRTRASGVGGYALPAPLLPFADEGAVSVEKRIERLLEQAEHALPAARPETPAQIALAWATTGMLACLGAGLLASSEATCVAHCTLELLQRVL